MKDIERRIAEYERLGELDQLEEQVIEEAVTVEDIRSNLKRTKDGVVRQTIYNCLYALRHDPVFSEAIRKNLMTGRIVIAKEMTWKREGENYTDVDEDNLKLYLEEKVHAHKRKEDPLSRQYRFQR